MALLKRVDWHDNELPYSQAEIDRYEARVKRVRREVDEIRTAADAMRSVGGAFYTEVADWLTWEARLLERVNEVDGSIELEWQHDTRESKNEAPTSGRRALLLARAWHQEHGQEGDGAHV